MEAKIVEGLRCLPGAHIRRHQGMYASDALHGP
jgi:hypothetical protein